MVNRAVGESRIFKQKGDDCDFAIRATISMGQRAVLLFFGCVFLWSSISKIMAPDDFAQTLGAHYLLDGAPMKVLVYLVPSLELALAIRLFRQKEPYETAFLCFCAILFFTALACFALFLGLPGGCGCFGKAVDDHFSALGALIRNAVLLVINLSFFFSCDHKAKIIRSGGFTGGNSGALPAGNNTR